MTARPQHQQHKQQQQQQQRQQPAKTPSPTPSPYRIDWEQVHSKLLADGWEFQLSENGARLWRYLPLGLTVSQRQVERRVRKAVGAELPGANAPGSSAARP